MRKLDVKEIHGFNASRGLKLLKPSALAGTKPPAPGARAGAGGTKGGRHA